MYICAKKTFYRMEINFDRNIAHSMIRFAFTKIHNRRTVIADDLPHMDRGDRHKCDGKVKHTECNCLNSWNIKIENKNSLDEIRDPTRRSEFQFEIKNALQYTML